MNIMYLIYSYNAGGGIETLLRDLMHGVVQDGNSVELCIINMDYSDAMLRSLDSRIHITLLNRKPGTKHQLHYMLRFAKLVHNKRIDILHCQGINCVLFAVLAKALTPRIRIINTVHDSRDYPSYPKWKILLSNHFLDLTIAISDYVKQTILSRGLDPRKIVTIYNAIDTTKFQPVGEADNFKKSESTIGNSLIIGNVARFFPDKKGQDTLVQAIEIILKKESSDPTIGNICCFFAGSIFKGQEKKYKDLLDYINRNNLKKSIFFLGNVNNVPNFLHSIDIFVLPSNYEGFGIALIEALACGIPCIASNLEGPKEIFQMANKDGIDIGILCPAGDPSSFAKAILDVRGRLSTYHPEEMYAFVKRHFSIESSVALHCAIYKDLYPKKKKSHT